MSLLVTRGELVSVLGTYDRFSRCYELKFVLPLRFRNAVRRFRAGQRDQKQHEPHEPGPGIVSGHHDHTAAAAAAGLQRSAGADAEQRGAAHVRGDLVLHHPAAAAETRGGRAVQGRVGGSAAAAGRTDDGRVRAGRRSLRRDQRENVAGLLVLFEAEAAQPRRPSAAALSAQQGSEHDAAPGQAESAAAGGLGAVDQAAAAAADALAGTLYLSTVLL